MSDGALVEFGSIIAAVNYALAIEQGTVGDEPERANGKSRHVGRDRGNGGFRIDAVVTTNKQHRSDLHRRRLACRMARGVVHIARLDSGGGCHVQAVR